MMRSHHLLIAALALLVAGCGAKSNGDAPSAAAPAAKSAPASGASAMAAVSKYDAGPRAAETPADEEQAERGEKLFSNKGCTACHAFGKKMSGPDLAGVTMRRTAAWMEHQILDPALMVKTDPIARELFAKHALQMPNQGLKREEALAVIEFLKHRDHESGEHAGK